MFLCSFQSDSDSKYFYYRYNEKSIISLKWKRVFTNKLKKILKYNIRCSTASKYNLIKNTSACKLIELNHYEDFFNYKLSF